MTTFIGVKEVIPISEAEARRCPYWANEGKHKAHWNPTRKMWVCSDCRVIKTSLGTYYREVLHHRATP